MKILRNLDWRTICVELLIVFIGLVAAFRVDEWAEDRELRRQEHRMLLRLEQDIDATLEFLEGGDGEGGRPGYLDFVESNRRGVSQVVRSLQAGSIVNGDTVSFEHGLIYYGHLPNLQISRAAFDEMLASGVFSLVRDEELKREISDLYDSAESARANFTWWRNVVFVLEETIADRVRYVSADVSGGVTARSHDVEFEFRDLVGDLELYNRFYWMLDTYDDWIRATGRLHGRVSEVDRKLSAYLATFD